MKKVCKMIDRVLILYCLGAKIVLILVCLDADTGSNSGVPLWILRMVLILVCLDA